MIQIIDIMGWERRGVSSRRKRHNHHFIITACGMNKSELKILTRRDSFSVLIKVYPKTNMIITPPLNLLCYAFRRDVENIPPGHCPL